MTTTKTLLTSLMGATIFCALPCEGAQLTGGRWGHPIYTPSTKTSPVQPPHVGDAQPPVQPFTPAAPSAPRQPIEFDAYDGLQARYDANLSSTLKIVEKLTKSKEDARRLQALVDSADQAFADLNAVLTKSKSEHEAVNAALALLQTESDVMRDQLGQMTSHAHDVSKHLDTILDEHESGSVDHIVALKAQFTKDLEERRLLQEKRDAEERNAELARQTAETARIRDDLNSQFEKMTEDERMIATSSADPATKEGWINEKLTEALPRIALLASPKI